VHASRLLRRVVHWKNRSIYCLRSYNLPDHIHLHFLVKILIVIAGIIGGWVAVVFTGKMVFGGGGDEPVTVSAVSTSAPTGAIPDVDSAEFDKFIENEENLNKLIESWEK